MRYAEGNKYSNGRPKGSPNKIQAKVRNILAEIINNQVENNLEVDLAKMQPKARWETIAKLAPYAGLKTTTEIEFDGHLETSIDLTEITEETLRKIIQKNLDESSE